MTPITVETLKAKKACQKQINLFQEHFPGGVVVTVEAAKSGVALLWQAYLERKALLLQAYEEGKAETFARIYIEENSKKEVNK